MGKKFKIIATLLIFILCFQVMSPTIYALDMVNGIGQTIFTEVTNTTVEENTEQSEPITKENYIIGEDISKREINTKYFLLNNGETMAAVYPFAVHYEENGELKDINNSLTRGTDEEKEDILQNSKNSFKVKLAKKSNKNKLITISTKDFKLKWSLDNANKVEATTLIKSTQFTQGEREKNNFLNKVKVNNLSSSVIYRSILQDVDIQYDIQSDNIKESIILKSKNAIDSNIVFRLDAGKLVAEMNENKEIIFYDETKENVVYQIDPMFMYDAKQEYSNKVEMKLEKDKKEYILTIIPDKEWLSSEERQYPITIDPTISTSVARNDIQHSYIFNGDTGYPTRHEAHVIRIGSNNRLHYPTRGLIKFTLPELNSGDQVISATMAICSYKDSDTPNPSREMQIDVHKMTKDWGGANTYWSNLNDSYNPIIQDYVLFKFDSNDWFQWKEFDITSIVKEWYTTGNNYGVMLKEHNEVYNYADSDAYFLSSDTSSAYEAGRPIISIVYRNQTGLESYLSYHTQEIGRAGTINTNDYNGNVVLTHTDASTPGNRLPVSIYHVYNTNDRNVNIGYGKGVRLNLSQTLSMHTIDEKEYVKYIDEDGTAHYFPRKDNTSIYLDEDGLELKLTKNDSTFTMEDKAGNKSTFIKHTNNSNLWHLKEIQDTNGNKITLNLSHSSSGIFQITDVTDGAGDKLTLAYSNGKLSSITDSSGRKIQYTYQNDLLTQITYPDSKNSTYSYNSNNQIEKVTNIDNSNVRYEYYSAKPYRVKDIKEYGTDNSVGNTLEIEYKNNITSFKDNEGYTSNIVFDDLGHAVSISNMGKNDNSSEAYGMMAEYGSGETVNKLTLEGTLRKSVNNILINGNAEIPSRAWRAENKGTNSGSQIYTTDEAYYGDRSLKISTTTSNNTFPIWAQTVDVKNGETYTVSTYVKTDGISCTGQAGAVLYVEFTNSSGQTETRYEYVQTTSAWTKISITFYYSSGAQNLKIGVGIKNAQGTAYFDAIQLEPGEVANTYNLAENTAFDYEPNIYLNWINANCTSDDGIVTDSSQKNSYRLTGDVNAKKEVYQTVYVSGKSGDVLNISAWVNNQGIRRDNYATRIAVGIIGADEQKSWVDIPVLGGTDGWQYVSKEIVTKKDYVRIEVKLCFYNNVNTVKIKNIGVYKDEFGQSYVYDKNGNVISVTDKANQTSNFQYNGNGGLLKEINPKGGDYSYEYDYWHKQRLLNATNNLGLNYTFTYDQYGNTTSVKVEESANTSTVQSGKTYYIRFASSGRYLDVPSASTEDGKVMQQYDIYREAQNQKYTITQVDGEYYKISPNHTSGKCLDLYARDSVLLQWTYNGGDNQKWKFISNGDGTYRIVNKSKGDDYCLTIEDDKSGNGARILAEKWEGKLNQKIQLKEVSAEEGAALNYDFLEGNELYHIKSKKSGLYLEQTSDSNGAKIVQNKYDGNNKNQLWRIVRDEDNNYRFINQGSMSGKVLEVPDGDNTSGKILQMWDNAMPNTSQNWQIRKGDGDTYTIISRLSGTQRAISIKDNSTSEGANICLYDSNYNDNQLFYLEKANMMDIESGATYKIRGKSSGRYVGVNNGNVELQDSSSSTAQQWIVQDLYNGYYKLISKQDTSKALDVDSYGESDGTNIHVYNIGDNNAQKFEIVPADEGYFSIRTRTTKGKGCLDVAGGEVSAGTNIQQYTNNNSNAQQFAFEKINSVNNNKYIQTTAEYSNNGRYLSKITDQIGNAITYTYNTSTGTIKTETDSKNKTTNYTYDNLDRTTKVSKTAGDKTYENTYSYENDSLKTITHNGITYQFVYDTFGNRIQTKLGNQTLITNTYDSNNGNLNKSEYGNGQIIQYQYDQFDRIRNEIKQTGTVQYTFDARGNLGRVEDQGNGIISKYSYDLGNRLTRVDRDNGQTIKYGYDANNNVDNVKYGLNTTQNEVKYIYDRSGRINNIQANNLMLLSKYDRLSRTTAKELKVGSKTYETIYEYLDTNTTNKTTTLVKSIKNGNNATISYTYDSNGNIETISEGTTQQAKYYYDDLNQLIREDNKILNKTIIYSYDTGGNLTQKKTYSYTTSTTPSNLEQTINYSYGNTNWKDQLTSYNGKTITYDAIGNPLTYNGNTYTWQNGRQLSSITNSSNNISYKYNEDGMRIEKTVNGVTTKYYLDGSKVIYETKENNTIYYTYDEQNNIIGMKYNENQYYYIKNIQNDVIGILDSNLNEIVKYKYDAWGKVISITNVNGQTITDQNNIGNINPYRYRSYQYDAETGMYYLQSRYYNPEWGRYINADNLVQTGQGMLDKNMYVYCENNPINRVDSNGRFWKEISNFFKEIGNAIADFFGASSQVSIQKEKDISSTPLYSPVSVKTGVIVSTVTSSKGNSSKKVSVYTNEVSNNPLSSTAGIKINIAKCSFEFGVGFNNTSLKFSILNENVTTSTALKMNIEKLQIGFEAEVETRIKENVYESAYTNASINAAIIGAIYMLVRTGSWNNSMQPAY